jgi:tetratricopeptide (TPR) repeat protein
VRAVERRSWGAPDAVALLAVLVVTAAAFHGVVRNGFLNWDDDAALVGNVALDGPGVLRWAFTTDHMSHYQPLSWLAWAGARRLLGAGAPAHHLASLAAHLLNAGLVFALAWRLGSLAGLNAGPRRVSALAAALVFGVHPLRVEPVAWASAFPYPLALAPLLVSVIAYLAAARPGGLSAPWLALSLLSYAVSLLCRAAAPGLPLVLLALDFGLGRLRLTGWPRALLEKLPYALLALLALVAEAGTRDFAAFERVGPGARAADAAIAPFLYLLRSAWPVGLSPLDVQPLEAKAVLPVLFSGLVLLVAVTVLAWRQRARLPMLCGAWLAYLVLLAPASGLAPSGLQATADRYAYLPGVPVALLVGAIAARLWTDERRRAVSLTAGLALVGALAWATSRQVGFWRDSATLWTRALELNPRNDVAQYNLALALAETGDEAGAAAGYRRVLEMIPEHGPARHNLDVLEAARLEREAGAAAAAGLLSEAVTLYGQALERDPQRLHSRRSRGMALAQLGRFEEAVPDLRAAVAAGGEEPAVVLALQFALERTGHADEAAAPADRPEPPH